MALRDLQIIGFDATLWYSAVQDHGGWHDAYQNFARRVSTASGPVVADHLFVNMAVFRRQGDLTSHFCDRQPPVTGSFVNVAEYLGDMMI